MLSRISITAVRCVSRRAIISELAIADYRSHATQRAAVMEISLYCNLAECEIVSVSNFLVSFLFLVFVLFRGIYRLNRHNDSAEVEMFGEAVFARITDLKFIEKIGMLSGKCYS